jgi:hypothetical protein
MVIFGEHRVNAFILHLLFIAAAESHRVAELFLPCCNWVLVMPASTLKP